MQKETKTVFNQLHFDYIMRQHKIEFLQDQKVRNMIRGQYQYGDIFRLICDNNVFYDVYVQKNNGYGFEMWEFDYLKKCSLKDGKIIDYIIEMNEYNCTTLLTLGSIVYHRFQKFFYEEVIEYQESTENCHICLEQGNKDNKVYNMVCKINKCHQFYCESCYKQKFDKCLICKKKQQ